MTAQRKFPIPYDYFKAIVALFLILLILWAWRNSGPPPTASVAVDPSGVVTISGEARPGALASLTLRHPDGSLEKLTARADDAGRWLASKRLRPGEYQVTVTVGAKKSPPQSFTVPETAALEAISLRKSASAPDLLSGRASPGSQLLVLVDGKEAGRVTAGPDGRWSYRLQASAGSHTVQLVYARAPEITSPSLTVELPRPAPPAISEARVAGGAVSLAGSAAPGSTVRIFADGKLVKTVTAGDDGSWSAVFDLPPGKHEVSVSGEGGAGPPVAVTVPAGQEKKTSGGGFAYVVKEDDWLSKLAREYLGSEERYREIREATNARARQDPSFATIEDDNLIYPGEKIWIPAP